MGGLTWEDLAAVDDCEYVETSVAEWGEDKRFYVKTLTVAEAEEVGKAVNAGGMTNHHLHAYYVSKCCFQLDKKTPLIPNSKIKAFKESRQAQVVALLYIECKRVNGLIIEDAKEVEEGDSGND